MLQFYYNVLNLFFKSKSIILHSVLFVYPLSTLFKTQKNIFSEVKILNKKLSQNLHINFDIYAFLY